MSSFKLKIFLAFVAILCISSSFAAPNQAEIDCTITRKCSTNEEIVWATDYKQCFVFRNPCIFATEMCLRKARGEEELKVVSKKKCKKHCQDVCTEQYEPVCAEYNKVLKTFSNKCDFYRHSCQKGESYIFLNDGACPTTDE